MLAERDCHSCTEHRHQSRRQRHWLPPPGLQFSVDEISRELVKLGVSETSPSRLIAIKRDLDELIRQDLEMARSQSSIESSAPHHLHRHRQVLTSGGSIASTDIETYNQNSSNTNRSSCHQHRSSTRPDAEGDFPSSRNSTPHEGSCPVRDQRCHSQHQQQHAEAGHPDGQRKFKFHPPLQSASVESLESRLDYQSWSSQSSTAAVDESLNDLLSETIYMQDDDDEEEEEEEGEEKDAEEAQSVNFEEKDEQAVLESYQLLSGSTSTLCSHDLSPVSAPPSPREDDSLPAGPRVYSIKSDQKVKFQHNLALPPHVQTTPDEVETGNKSARVEADQARQHRSYPRPNGVQYLDLPSAYKTRVSKTLPDPKKLKKKLNGLFVPYRMASDDTAGSRRIPVDGAADHLAPPLIPREQLALAVGDKRRARKTHRRSTSNHLPTCSRHVNNAAQPTNQPKRKSILRSRTRSLNADHDGCDDESAGYCPAVKRNRACGTRIRADPVTLFHAYRRQWRNTLVPGENDRRSLRWSVKAAMMIREIPVLPSSGRSVRSNFNVYPGTPRKRISSSSSSSAAARHGSRFPLEHVPY
uniref:Hydrolethalus syndrome protein 1 n=1 Tax=Schistocephalus solidus TaxID=70667 RepID=A0A0X3PKN7_SCHSO